MQIFKINARPGRVGALILSALPFIALIVVYGVASHVRHEENPDDKLMPSYQKMADGFYRTAAVPDRKGEYRLLVDTVASTRRFAISTALCSVAILVGLLMGVLPYCEKLLLRFALFFDKIPALALLPILFIVFGLGEVSKIALIVIGVFPTIILDTYLRGQAVPQEHITKGLTLGASDMEVAFHIVLPQILPGVLDTIRLNFKAIILFLIAGESLAATAGLGYRIFVVRRYLAMEVIIPYVIWMSVLAFLADLAVRYFIRWRYGWLEQGAKA